MFVSYIINTRGVPRGVTMCTGNPFTRRKFEIYIYVNMIICTYYPYVSPRFIIFMSENSVLACLFYIAPDVK